ncbi:uncharacterized protein UDID_17188 [Ustilago sp. UG-2017a]|nr:uncharacterized protein UDID_17188 [Ustilago sp. UG-2017a]
MPPSTRAGQMGRGDDDQVTAGNGHEEGWLTQVVKILQLANPALTAEEAIIQAMSLISISNQAPRGETEKIPKDVVHNAKEILYGTIAPGDKEYNEDLDKALVGLIHACCDNSPDSRVDTYTITGADEEVQLTGLQDHIHTVRLHNRDVVKLGKELDSIWNDTVRLGRRFDEDLKKSTLYRCTAQGWFYANLSAVAHLKPEICSSVFGITILTELCRSDVPMALLTQICSCSNAIADFD